MSKGCLVVHGLSGTPATVAILQDKLLAAGFRVAAPCLAGHGGSVEELGRVAWREWYETVRVAFAALRREVDRVYFAGISLGALLGLRLALDEGWGVRALALLATPLRLPWIQRLAVPAVRYTPLSWVVRTIPKDLKKSVGDPEGRRRYEELSLPAIPVRAVYEIVALQRELARNLRRVTNPMLILHGRRDLVAPPSNVELVRRSVGSDVVETAIFPRSRHVLTMDVEKEAVAQATVDFFKKFA